jgi:hypothetical protein
MWKNLVIVTIVAVMLSVSGLANAQEKPFKIEITPLAWFAGIGGDVTVGDREAEIDLSFSDILDVLKLGGGGIISAQAGPWIGFGQLDYISMDTDELGDDAPDLGNLETNMYLFTAAVGRQIRVSDKSTLDVLVGIRSLSLNSYLTIKGVGFREGDLNVIDGVLVLRPELRITDKLSFNSTISIGGGDSDFTMEGQPQLKYQVLDNVVARLGFRRIFYDLVGDVAEFEGAFQGLNFGVGVTF